MSETSGQLARRVIGDWLVRKQLPINQNENSKFEQAKMCWMGFLKRPWCMIKAELKVIEIIKYLRMKLVLVDANDAIVILKGKAFINSKIWESSVVSLLTSVSLDFIKARFCWFARIDYSFHIIIPHIGYNFLDVPSVISWAVQISGSTWPVAWLAAIRRSSVWLSWLTHSYRHILQIVVTPSLADWHPGSTVSPHLPECQWRVLHVD